jgi:hypothetical protein
MSSICAMYSGVDHGPGESCCPIIIICCGCWGAENDRGCCCLGGRGGGEGGTTQGDSARAIASRWRRVENSSKSSGRVLSLAGPRRRTCSHAVPSVCCVNIDFLWLGSAPEITYTSPLKGSTAGLRKGSEEPLTITAPPKSHLPLQLLRRVTYHYSSSEEPHTITATPKSHLLLK